MFRINFMMQSEFILMTEGREQNRINLMTESKGLNILLEVNQGFYIPNKEEKMKLYSLSGINYKKYSRSVDCIKLKVDSFELIQSVEDFDFVEVKTTKDIKVKKLPYGVFFGFTQNEENLFRELTNYKLCIVHTLLKEFYCMDFDEYLNLIKNKRIQFQINFKTKS
jgi:hypothetical protein